MKLIDIIVGHIRRKRSRFLFLTLTLTFGVAAIVAMFSVTDTMSLQAEERLNRFGANIVMMPGRDSLPLVYGGMALGDVGGEVRYFEESELPAIRTIRNSRNLGVVSPKIVGVVAPDGLSEERLLMVGADLDEEYALKTWWAFTGELPDAPGEIMAGFDAAKRLDLEVGERLFIEGKPLQVTAILNSSGSSDDGVLFGDLAEVQAILGKEGKVSLVEIAAFCRGCPISDMVLQIAEKFPGARVTALSQAVMSKMQSIEMIKGFGLGAALFVAVIGALLVFMLTTSSVNERTREIGIFRAMGFRRSHIMEVMLLESVMASGVAAILGIFFGHLLARFLIPAMMTGMAPPVMNWTMAAWTLAITLAVALVAGLAPALKASRLDPSEALRSLN